MLILPTEMKKVILPFVSLFSETVWDYAQILLMGAILAPGVRTVSATLTVMGLKDDPQYQNYYRVLNRAKWCSRTASYLLLGVIIQTFVTAGVPIVIGVDETLERRQGDKIKQKSVFRDSVRSSKKHTVYSYGIRWVSMMAIVSVPWSDRAKTNSANGKRHKTSIDWICYLVSVVRGWLPERAIVLVTDGGLTAIKLGLACCQAITPVTWVSRLRLDACLYTWPGNDGGQSQSLGMAIKRERLKSSPVLHCGTPPASTPCRFAMYSSVTHWASSNQQPFFVHGLMSNHDKFCYGSFCVGMLRSLFKKHGGISVLKHNVNTPTRRLNAPHLCCSVCFRS